MADLELLSQFASIPERFQSVALDAYRWGWPLVNLASRANHARSLADNTTIILGGVPLSYGRLTMLTGYMSLEQRAIACPNRDTVYGAGFFDLSQGPVVFQVPDLSQQRYWSYSFYDARTDEFGTIGKEHATPEGFYLLAAPGVLPPLPAGIPPENVVQSKTDLVFAVARIYVNDPVAEHDAIVAMTRRIAFYPRDEYQPDQWVGKDWSALTDSFPHFWDWRKDEYAFVRPGAFFVRELPQVLDSVEPQAWEKDLYEQMRQLVDYARMHRIEMRLLGHQAETNVIAPLLEWSMNGVPADRGWKASSPDAGNWGENYLQRAATARSNMFESLPGSTRYFFTDNDNQGQPLDGSCNYAITFPAGQLPADYVNGFWSISLYDEYHFFNTAANEVQQYTLGTKDDLKPDGDGNLTIYAGWANPGGDRERLWLPAEPGAPFSLYIRLYWPKKDLIGNWKPPAIVQC